MKSALRLAFVAALVFGTASPGFAADAVTRLTGELNYKNYPKLAAFLKKAGKKAVAFDITLPIDNEESDGHMTTFGLDGQFEIAYLAGKKTSKIYADVGYDLVNDDHYTLKGTYTVDQPTADEPSYGLNAVEKEPASFKDTSIDSLPEKGKN